MQRCWIIGLLFFAAICFSCSSKSNNGGNGGGGGGDGTNPPGPDITVGNAITIDDVETATSGVAPASISLAATPDGQWAVAYYRAGQLVPNGCTVPITGGGFTPDMLDEVSYAWFDGANWNLESVDQIHSSFLGGISLVFNKASPAQALIAYLGGPDSQQCCGGSKLIQASRDTTGNWVISNPPIVSSSGQAASGTDPAHPDINDPGHYNCPVGQNLCDTGDMVGLWPSQAVAPDGTIGIVYKDLHLCYAITDVDNSDVELAYTNGTNWAHEWIDLGRGGGSYSRLVYDSNNVPAATFYNGTIGSIFFSKRGASQWPWDYCGKFGTQQYQCLPGYTCDNGGSQPSMRCGIEVATNVSGLPEGSLSLAIGPDGSYLLAHFDPKNFNLVFSYSTDGVTWQSGAIDTDGSIGKFPNILIDPKTKNPIVVYYRCGDYTDGLNCNPNSDGLRLAVFVGNYPGDLTTKAKWKRYDEQYFPFDKSATDGSFASAAIQPDRTIGVAYLYTYTDSTGTHKYLMFRTITFNNQ